MSRAARSERACGRAIEQMVEALNNYCLEFTGATDSSVGDDALFGGEVRDILRGVRELLNGPTGELNCGEMDGKILAIARRNGLADENGEL